MPIEIPGARELAGVPLLGDLAKIISGHSILTYVTILLVPLTAWALAKTRFGLRLRAVGENPHAVDTAGISVARLRYQAVIIAGILCGMAGAFMSTSLSASFVRDMTAGRGFMALAALIFATGGPGRRSMPVCCLVSCRPAATICKASASAGFEVPVQFINMLPYLLTVVLLAGFIGKSIPPRASGIPYTKDR